MIEISLCMIVKNEEKVLARCLDSIADLMDEIIIVDTGSTDATKEIAARYTDRIYDFEWVEDFSAARNFSFSKATRDYIYTADADEVLDEENRQRFRELKELLLPEIEIVQMKYCNQLSQGTAYNFDEEYRPKLYKRQREFVWIEPVHEMVRLDPVVYVFSTCRKHFTAAGISGSFKNRSKKGCGCPSACTICMPWSYSYREEIRTFWKRSPFLWHRQKMLPAAWMRSGRRHALRRGRPDSGETAMAF